MSSLNQLSEGDVLAVSGARNEPDWLRDRRQEAFKAFADLEWPDRKVEEWRYTDPGRFDRDRELVGATGDVPAPTKGVVAALEGTVAAMVRIVDGGVAEAAVLPDAAAQGVVVSDLATAAREFPDVVQDNLGSAVGSDEKFDALNLAAFTGGAFVYVPPETEVSDPITVTVQVGADGAHTPRVLVVLGQFAKADVYIDHHGDAAATVVEVVEVVAGDGARAQVVTSQDWGSGVDHVGTHRGLTKREASYRHLEVSLGGRTVYLRPAVRLDNPGSRGELYGVYFGAGEQQMEMRSLLHHNASNTSSESVYKGALQGRSRTTWYGNIRIEPHAKATSSDETNRNLILTDGAHADSLPFLEIMCSDVVECGHHSSVGQVDEIELFYLTSRGIPREEAVRMLVFGFFGEVTDRLDLPGVTETVLEEVADEIRSGEFALMDPRRA